jgi:hypothetical protein
VANDFLRNNFFIWGVNMLGGAFVSDLADITFFNKITPGAMFDNQLRFYDSANERDINFEYVHSPPFANVVGLPASCNQAAITAAGGGSCAATLDIHTWFDAGTVAAFPAGWTGATTIEVGVQSKCQDAFPSAFLTCNGECTSTGESGCCIMSRPFKVVNGACPSGYSASTISSSVTDFLFDEQVYTPATVDTTLINFLQLLETRDIDFAPSTNSAPTFVSPKPPTGTPPSICMINGSTFGKNVETWADNTFTENCTATSLGCPQIKPPPGGGITGCTSATCTGTPAGTDCGTSCPSSNPVDCNVVGNCPETAAAKWVSPALALAVIPLLLV